MNTATALMKPPASDQGTTQNSTRALTGPERAAVIMLTLGEENSRPLWESLDDEELREITVAISTLGSVTADMVEASMLHFVDSFSQTGPVTGSVDAARRMLTGILPTDKVNTILEDIKGPAGKTMWDKLANVSPSILARYLSNEHPQTVAVILSRVAPDHTAQVIAKLPPMIAEETINRMLSLGPVEQEVLQSIEHTLKSEFITTLTQIQGHDSHELMAEIFNSFDRATERHFMENLEAKNPTAADRIKSLMFVFEDLQNIDDHDIQMLLRHTDKSVLATALKTASSEMQALFFNNMSERASKILRDDIEIMRPLRMREIDSAQTEIVNIAKNLSAEGKIFLSKRDDGEVIF